MKCVIYTRKKKSVCIDAVPDFGGLLCKPQTYLQNMHVCQTCGLVCVSSPVDRSGILQAQLLWLMTPCSVTSLLVCRAATWLPKFPSWMSSLNLMLPERNTRKGHAPAFSMECPSMSMDTQVTPSYNAYSYIVASLFLFPLTVQSVCNSLVV